MEKIGIIGFGNMGQAIASQLKGHYQLFVFDADKSKIKDIPGVYVARDNVDLTDKIDVVILAVKPQDLDGVLNEIKNYVKSKLVISIAAGITTKYIEKILGTARVVRAMPNMPAKIGEGTTCLSKGKFASLDDFDFTENLFDYLGETIRIEEAMMNAATAISGSGPAYCYDLMEAANINANDIEGVKKFVKEVFIPQLTLAAQTIGFPSEEARFLAVTTGNGCIGLIKKTRLNSFELVKQITSKGGTTEAALEVLHNGGSLEEAVKAALERAEELCKKELS